MTDFDAGTPRPGPPGREIPGAHEKAWAKYEMIQALEARIAESNPELRPSQVSWRALEEVRAAELQAASAKRQAELEASQTPQMKEAETLGDQLAADLMWLTHRFLPKHTPSFGHQKPVSDKALQRLRRVADHVAAAAAEGRRKL